MKAECPPQLSPPRFYDKVGLGPMSRGPLRHETLAFKCHSDQCKEGRTEPGHRTGSTWEPRRLPWGWEYRCLGKGATIEGGVCRDTYLIDLLDPPVNAIKGPAVGDVIHQEDPLQGRRRCHQAEGLARWRPLVPARSPRGDTHSDH